MTVKIQVELKDLPEQIVCEMCELRVGQWRRQNTQYYDDRSNWVFLCNDCNMLNEEHWAEMWRDYYAECL